MPLYDRRDLYWIDCDVLDQELVLVGPERHRLGRVYRNRNFKNWIVHMRRSAFPDDSPSFPDPYITAWEGGAKTREDAMEIAVIIASGHYVLLRDDSFSIYRKIVADCALLQRHYLTRGDGCIQGWFIESRDAMYVKMKYSQGKSDAETV